jgi:2-methylisocitrate lyase-like PEP mutase family enzyme
MLVLPNAWDAASARVLEEAGFPALGTSSGGIAFSLGFPDGQNAPFGEMVEAVRRIVRAVRVPVTADLESGYGDVEGSVRAVLRAGAVGLNLEDSDGGRLLDLSEQVDRIRRARRAAGRVPIVLNARTDGYWLGKASFLETVERCGAYRKAGADCLFVPGLRDPKTIRALVLTVGAPLNVLAGPGVPSLPRLEALGVARVSLGSGPMRSSLGRVRRIAGELSHRGTYRSMVEGAVSYREANALFRR